MSPLVSRSAAVGLLVLVLAAMYLLIVVPVLDARAELWVRTEAAASVLSRQQAILASLPALRGQVQALHAAEGQERGWLAPSSAAQAAALLQNLFKQATATETSIMIQSMQPLPPANEDGNTRIAVRITSTLPAAALPSLLARLAGNPEPVLLLDNAEIHRLDSGASWPGLSRVRHRPSHSAPTSWLFRSPARYRCEPAPPGLVPAR